MAADPYYHNREATGRYGHPGYGPPQGYQAQEPHSYGAPSQDNRLTTYEDPSQQAYPPQQQYPPYQQGYQQNQYAPQHQPGSGFAPQQYLPRRSPSPEPRQQSSEAFAKHEELTQEEKARGIGGGLIGAATGSLLGAKIGEKKGRSGLGTFVGLAAGAIGGHQIEDKIQELRHKKQQEKEQQEQRYEESQNYSQGKKGQSLDDDDDHEYTRAAYAAPGYGSSLLPSDASHGGHPGRHRRHRNGGSRYSDSDSG